MARCKFCRTKSETLKRFGIHWFCDYEHATAYALAKRTKDAEKEKRVKDKAAKAERAEFRRRRQRLNEQDPKWQKKRTSDVLHKLVKLLDADMPCIVCDKFECGNSTEWDAGHYLTKSAHPELKFDPRNIFKQCSPTNTASSGNRSSEASIKTKFEQNIIKHYGIELLTWLKGHHPQVKRTCEEYAEMRKVYAEESRRIERGEGPSRDWRSLK